MVFPLVQHNICRYTAVCCGLLHRVRFAFNRLHFRYSSAVQHSSKILFVTFCIIRIQLFYYTLPTQPNERTADRVNFLVLLYWYVSEGRKS